MDIGEAVKERILELCREENISINKLCSMSGVTQSTVNNIVSGRNHSATVSTIKKLCDGLGISIEEFFHSELFRGLEQELKKKQQQTGSNVGLLLFRLFSFTSFLSYYPYNAVSHRFYLFLVIAHSQCDADGSVCIFRWYFECLDDMGQGCLFGITG